MRRSLPNRLWQAFLKFLARLTAVTVFHVHCRGQSHVPATGGALVLSNHQSNLDPVVIGLVCERRLNYVARQTLFRFPPFRWLINSLDAIPIDREGSGLGGLKETLKRLKRGEMVLLFPEGTRTPDGEVHPLKPGFCAWPVAPACRSCLWRSTARTNRGRAAAASPPRNDPRRVRPANRTGRDREVER